MLVVVVYLFCAIASVLIFGQCGCHTHIKGDFLFEQMSQDISSLRAQLKISSNEKNAQLWGKLGFLLQRKDNLYSENAVEMQSEALHCLNQAIQLGSETLEVTVGDMSRQIMPSILLLTHRKGTLLKTMGRTAEAVATHDWAYRHADNLSDQAESLYCKGMALIQWGHLEEAIETLRMVTVMFPNKLNTYKVLVEALLELHVPERELRQLYEHLEGVLEYWEAKKSEVMAEIAAVKVGAAVPVDDTSPDGSAYWALFLLGDKLKDYTRAWKYLDIAHDLVKHSRPLIKDLTSDMQQAQQIEHIFDQNFFPAIQGAGITGMATKTPIFIVGMMRSGSTLTETMLDAHPDIFGMGEDSVFRANAGDLRDSFVAANQLPDTHMRAPAMKKTVHGFGELIEQTMLALAKNATTADGGVSNVGTVKHVVDKMLFNYRNIGFIHLVFPKAVIIHTMRDPMDTLYSCTRHLFAEGFEWTLDAEQLAQQYYLYLRIMEHFRKVLPGRVVDVRYEQLIHDPETVMRQVIEKIGDIEWDESILNFHSSKRIVHTPSLSQVRHKLYKGSIGYWRKYAKQLEPVSSALKRYLKNFKRPLPYANEINWDLDPNWDKYAELGMEPAPESSVYAGKPVVGPHNVADVSSNNRSIYADKEDRMLQKNIKPKKTKKSYPHFKTSNDISFESKKDTKKAKNEKQKKSNKKTTGTKIKSKTRNTGTTNVAADTTKKKSKSSKSRSTVDTRRKKKIKKIATAEL